MKIRNGFVSNSSSSSFIIKKDTFIDNKTIALSMLDDYVYIYDDDYHLKKYNICKELLNSIDNDTNIMFNSTNYDTFITNLDSNYTHISTCNNIDWSIEKFAIDLPDDISNDIKNNIVYYRKNESYLIDGNNELYDDNDKPILSKSSPFRNTKYFKVDSGFFVKKVKPYQSCDKCYHELYIVGRKKLCLNCDNGYILRSLKLSNINKNKNKKM